MTDLRTEAGDPLTEEELDERLREEVKRTSAVARHAVMPLLLLAALAALFYFLSQSQLDVIEGRVLNWPNIRQRLDQHIRIAGLATVLIVAISVPLGVILTRPWARSITPVSLSIANGGQAIPSLGLLALLLVAFLWPSFRTAVVALVIYGILPVLRNTMVGITQVDPAEIEAGRGMGMTRRQVLWQIELPLAVPVILAGVRVSLILCVGTATLAWTIGAGGLGLIIAQGISMGRMPVLLTGATITAVLALAVDWLAGVVEDVLRPRGL